MDFTGNKSLKPQNGAGRHDDGIHKTLRHRRMPTTTVERDAQIIARAGHRTGADTDDASTRGNDVPAENYIGNRNIVSIGIVQPVVHHALRTGTTLFSRLEDKDNDTAPLVSSRDHEFGIC